MKQDKLKQIKQKALEEHIPIIMDDTLEVIEKELKENPPKRILEIGAAVGYSAMCFSEFLADGGKIDTIERDEERIKEAKINFKNVGVEEKIKLYEGDAVEILPTLNEKYDVVFIDAAKGKYPKAKKTITLTVKPVKTRIASVKSTKSKNMVVKWKKDTKATGYVIQYSTDKKFKKGVKTVTITKNKTTSKTIGKLKGGKNYYVRVCTYKKSNGKQIKGSYSAVKSIKVKK